MISYITYGPPFLRLKIPREVLKSLRFSNKGPLPLTLYHKFQVIPVRYFFGDKDAGNGHDQTSDITQS